jgi:hypothetical protein
VTVEIKTTGRHLSGTAHGNEVPLPRLYALLGTPRNLASDLRRSFILDGRDWLDKARREVRWLRRDKIRMLSGMTNQI